MSTLRVSGHLSWHGGQALGARTLRVAPHDLACERAPLPVLAVCSRVALHLLGDKFVNVILDVTPIRDRRGPSRLLDMVPGRSKRVFKTWLASQPDTWRENIEIVAMDEFTGFKSAAAEKLPDARAVMDPFHVVHLGRECSR